MGPEGGVSGLPGGQDERLKVLAAPTTTNARMDTSILAMHG